MYIYIYICAHDSASVGCALETRVQRERRRPRTQQHTTCRLVRKRRIKCLKRRIQVSQETYSSVKRDLFKCQKRPIQVSKETYQVSKETYQET